MPRSALTLSLCLAAALTLCLLSSRALASEPTSPATPMTWETLPAAIEQSWRDEKLPIWQRELEGIQAQRSVLPNRLSEVRAQTSHQIPISSMPWSGSEQNLGVGLSLLLGPLPQKMRALVEAQLDREHAMLALARWHHAMLIQDAYKLWWLKAQSLIHLREDLIAAQLAMQPIQRAADQSELAALDLLDLQVELGRLLQELAALELQTQSALGELTALLDLASWEPVLGELPDHALEENPWRDAHTLLRGHPTLQALKQERAILLARADVEAHQAPMTLQTDLAYTPLGWQRTWLTWQVGIVIPLSNPGKAEAARLSAQAAGVNATLVMTQRQLERELKARAASYETIYLQLQQLNKNQINPLRDRQARLDEALKANEVTLVRVLRARRELHEAEHLERELRLSLHAERLAASLWSEWLNTSSNPASR